MTQRYVITSRQPNSDPVLTESDGLSIRARLDRGLLVDVDDPSVLDELSNQGLRIKPLPDHDVIRLFDYEIDTTNDDPTRVPELPGVVFESGIGRNFLINFAGPLQESWAETLHTRDVAMIEPIGQYGYFVQADPAIAEQLVGLSFIDWVGPFEPAYKVNPVLLTGDGGALTEIETSDGSDAAVELAPTIVGIHVGMLADGDLDAIVAIIEDNNGELLDDDANSRDIYRNLLATFDASAIAGLATRDDVRWIDPLYESVIEDERTAQISYEDLDGTAAPGTGPNTGYVANLAALGYDGGGTTIAICDTGVSTNVAATMHADLNGRFAFSVNGTGAAVNTADANGHGTHVAGIAAGNGASGDTDPGGFVLGQGAAPGAQIGSITATGADTWANRIATASQNGADVMNSSLGVNTAGSAYSASDRAIDLGVRDADPAAAGNSEIALVFSAGNSGSGATTCTKATKNSILAGNALNFRPGEGNASDDIRGVRSDSSRGPAVDGRLLPTLTAPGTDVVSARGGFRGAYTDTGGNVHNTHSSLSGTSMAAPMVTGMCAVITEWWRDTRNGATPSPALLKAILSISAESTEGGDDGAGGTIAAGPNNDTGWGRISLENTLLQAPASNHGHKIFNDQRHAFTATGQEYRIRVAADNPSLPLRVALAWTDAAGAVGASPALVNDLDLEVTQESSGTTFLGNNFNDDASTAGGTADSLNNLEIVAIQNPTGIYEISVVAANLTASARTDIAGTWQDFALVIDNGEVPAADPVSVVPVIDRSGSMVSSGYVDITRQSSRQFVEMMSIDDSLGIVSFGTTASQDFPAAGLATITDQSVRDDAIDAINAMPFGGCTFMGGGIEQASNLLAGAGPRSAIVLLSDGYDNKGCDQSNPLKPSALDAAGAMPSALPIYSCAMGPSSDQALLEQLATDTDGRYYYMPTIDDLFEIYNFIRGQVTGEGVIVNESSMASRSSVRGFVDACSDRVTFSIAWPDPKMRYVAREAIKKNEVSVRLRTPSGRWVPHSATEINRSAGDGYVAFVVDDPQPGWWTVEVSTARSTHTPYTVGGFVRSPIRLDLDLGKAVLGQALQIQARVTDNKEPVDKVKVISTALVPQSFDRLFDKHRGALDRVKLPKQLLKDGKLDDHQTMVAKLTLLRDQMRADDGSDILAPTPTKIKMAVGARRQRGPLINRIDDRIADRVGSFGRLAPPSGAVSTLTRPLGEVFDWRRIGAPSRVKGITGVLEKLSTPGSYSVRVVAAGYSPICGTRFVRTELASTFVKG